MNDENIGREYVSLDNLTEYELAKDPNNFFSIHKLPILIDEIQYAPGLFRKIKEIVDIKTTRLIQSHCGHNYKKVA